MEAIDRQFNSVNNRRGSALIMVVVLTVLLALIAAMFILMSRIDEMATKSIKPNYQLDAAVDVLVNKIGDVLVYDIYPSGSNRSSETWDYPKHRVSANDDGIFGTFDDSLSSGSNSDAWLASLEPEMVDLSEDYSDPLPTGNFQIGFKHITDLNLDGVSTFASRYNSDYYRHMKLSGPVGSFDPAYVDLEDDRISPRNLHAVILKPAQADDPDTWAAYGRKADADGDGVADSRWTYIRDMRTEKSDPIFVAIRIIDNGGMINVNTACRNPELLTVAANWDGSQLSHVNLEGITDSDPGSRYDAALIQEIRYGTVDPPDFDDYFSDIVYEANAARRLNDPMIVAPDEMFLPFDVGDELELRNRFFLTTSYNKVGTQSRLYHTWPVTFNPQADPGKGLPYRPGDDLDAWYDKVGPDSIGPADPSPGVGSSNRRHYSTTVSREAIFCPYSYNHLLSSNATPLNVEQKIGITLPLDIQDGSAGPGAVETFVKRLAMGIYRGLSGASVYQRFGSNHDNEELAWQMAVNMVDYQDDKIDYSTTPETDAPEEPAIVKVDDTTYFGTEDLETLKKNTLCISKIGYKITTSGGVKRYYGIEVFNPDDDTADGAKDLSDYKIIITDNSGYYKGEFDLSGTIEHSGSSDGADDTMAFLFNSSGQTSGDTISELEAVSTRVTFLSTPPVSTIAVNDKLIVINKTLDMPVDCVTVTSAFDGTNILRRRVILPGTNFLLPSVYGVSTTPLIDVWESSLISTTIALGERLGDALDPTPDGSTPKAELIEPAASTDPGVQQLEFVGVQLYVPNQQLSNLGEIENVFAVGTRYTHDDRGNTDKTDDIHRCTTLIQGIVESHVAITGAGTGSYDHQQDCEAFDPADPDSGIEMKSFGRIRLTDSNYWGLLDSLTYFDPARDGVDLQNIAEGIDIDDITVSGGSLDPLSDEKDTIVDGLFLQKDIFNPTHNSELYWTDMGTTIEIDVGTIGTPAVTPEVWGAIVQADYNDEYILEALVGTTWQTVMTVANNDPEGFLTSGGPQTRPDFEDDGRWQLFDTPVKAQKFRIKAVSTATDATEEFSLSEIQLGINNAPYVPYYYDKTIAGRININTAPWYVINQLPWIEDTTPEDTAVSHGALAQAIVAFRDKTATPAGEVGYFDFIDPATSLPVEGRGFTTGIDSADINEDTGFTNIAQLMQIIQAANNDLTLTTPPLVDFDIRKNIFDDADAVDGDYTPDTVDDDFEERNLLFHRISNLVTLRSDVFTAYILVRIGSNGPQRRMIAVFDRSEVKNADDKPKLLAIHPVPDPR